MFAICQADVNARRPDYLYYLKGMRIKTTGKELYYLLPHVKLPNT